MFGFYDRNPNVLEQWIVTLGRSFRGRAKAKIRTMHFGQYMTTWGPASSTFSSIETRQLRVSSRHSRAAAVIIPIIFALEVKEPRFSTAEGEPHFGPLVPLFALIGTKRAAAMTHKSVLDKL